MSLSISLTTRQHHRPYNRLKKQGRAALSFIFPAAAILLLSACGIPQYPYIYPAKTTYERGYDNIFTFTHNTKNENTIFEGYILFYRFYTDEYYEDIVDTYTDFISYLDEREEEDLSSTDIKNDSYENNGYYRLYFYDADEDDYFYALSIDSSLRGTGIAFSLDFSDVVNHYDEDVYATLSYEDTVLINLRYQLTNIGLGTYGYLSFVPNHFIYGQEDLPDNLYSSSEKTMYLALFVVPYGRDETLSLSYGNAATLGFISLRFKL